MAHSAIQYETVNKFKFIKLIIAYTNLNYNQMWVYTVKYRQSRCEVMAFAIVKFCANAQSEVKFAKTLAKQTSLHKQLHSQSELHLP